MKKFTDFEKSLDNNIKQEMKQEMKQENKTNEDVLLQPESNVSVEILEEKIIKFNNLKLDEILETLKTKYSDTNYYIRKKDDQLHIVKYNESLKLNINNFVDSLFKVYSSKPGLKKIVEGVKIKGNMNFCIIENLKFPYTDKFISDLTKLLSKK
jgi:hypothetical protein